MTFKIPEEYDRKWTEYVLKDGVLRLTYKKDLEEEKNEAKIYRLFGLTNIFKSPKSWRLLETTFLLSAFCLFSNLVQRSY